MVASSVSRSRSFARDTAGGNASIEAITRMVDAVQDWNLTEREGVYTLDVRDVDPVLPWIGPSTVVRVDAANRAEVVFGLLGVEGVEAELVGTAYHLEVADEDG